MADSLGAMLSGARGRLGWSLRNVERATGIPNAHISQLETGAIEHPGITVLVKLSKVYGLPMRDLAEAAGRGSDWEWSSEPELADARGLLEEALHLRMYGENAPGGNETWGDWDKRTEAFLRGAAPRTGRADRIVEG